MSDDPNPHSPRLPLLVGRPNLGDRDLFRNLVEGIFERRWFTNNGQLVQDLEARIAEYLGVGHCILVCNATIALQVACQALDLKGEVIVPSFTFVATPHSVQWEGITPIFADIDPQSHLLDPGLVEDLITARTTAILGVHAWGRACYPDHLQEIADRHGLALYFDAAHAFGCAHGDRMIGNFGRCEVFSFHATKFFNTFEGGGITTNDADLAHKIRLMINFGFWGMDKVVHLGTNGKMSEIHAAMGLSCLAALDSIVAVNRRHYEHYRRRLEGIPGVRFCHYDDMTRTNYQYVGIEVDPEVVGRSRDDILFALHAKGIMVRRYFYPGCHRLEPYATLYPEQSERLPVTESICRKMLVLPTGTGINDDEVDFVCREIRQLLGVA